MATSPATTPAKKAPVKKVAAQAAPIDSDVVAAAPAKRVKAPISMEATVFSTTGEKSGTITIPEEIFGVKWNADLVHQVVIGMQANARHSTAHTKFRGEVAGGGKKPWKQKGTGRARHGSNRSPIWRGGGVTHGPRTEKIYAVKINKKMRAAALMSVLSRKWKDGEILFVDNISFAGPKTKDAKAMLVGIAKTSGHGTLSTKRKNAAVIAFPVKDIAAEKSFQNIGSVISEEVRNLNPVDLMNKKYLVISQPAASFEVLMGRLPSKITK
jgi:large subunit ribosomal protein L4